MVVKAFFRCQRKPYGVIVVGVAEQRQRTTCSGPCHKRRLYFATYPSTCAPKVRSGSGARIRNLRKLPVQIDRRRSGNLPTHCRPTLSAPATAAVGELFSLIGRQVSEWSRPLSDRKEEMLKDRLWPAAAHDHDFIISRGHKMRQRRLRAHERRSTLDAVNGICLYFYLPLNKRAELLSPTSEAQKEKEPECESGKQSISESPVLKSPLSGMTPSWKRPLLN